MSRFFLVFLLTFSCITLVTYGVKYASTTSSHIPASTAKIIRHYDTFEALLVTPRPHEGQKRIIDKYGIAGIASSFDAEHAEALQSYLLDSENFRFAPIKKCVFIPEYAFIFSKNDHEIIVFAGLSCKQIEFHYAKTNKRGDCDKSIETLEAIIQGK